MTKVSLNQLAVYLCWLLISITGCSADHLEADLSGNMHALADPQHEHTPVSVFKAYQDGRATALDTNSPGFGVTDDTIWIIIDTQALDIPSDIEWVLEISWGRLGFIELTTLTQSATIESAFRQTSDTPLKERTIYSRSHEFPIKLSSETAAIVFRAQSRLLMELPTTLTAKSSADEKRTRSTLIVGLYFGIVLIMTCYNLLIFFITRERLYLLYSCSVFSFGFLLFIARGFGHFFAPDTWLPIFEPLALLGSVFPGTFLCLFVMAFLELEHQDRKAFRFLQGCIVILGGYVGAFPFLGDALRSHLLFGIATVLPCILIAVTIRRMHAGQRAATFLFWAWLGLTLGIVLMTLNRLGVLPRNVYTQNGLLLGSVIEMAILSLAIPFQLRELRREKGNLNQQLSQVKSDLAHEIIEREKIMQETRRLKEAVVRSKAEFDTITHELAAAEAQLIQAEKMASVGQLVASVTHDIANPTTHIMVSQAALQKELDHLRVKVMQQGDYEGLIPSIDAMIQYTRLIEGGASTISSIHRSFANYSRADTYMHERVDLEQTLKDALLILNSRVHPHVLEMRFSTCPHITCKPSEVCQAVANLISNAADALSGIGSKPAPSSPSHGTIHISMMPKAKADIPGLMIRIEDSGPGIEATELPRILEPFYTTKSAGEGTGLGLAITHRVVLRHHGHLEIARSQSLGGMCFELWFPTNQPTN